MPGVYSTNVDIKISAAINQPFTPAGDEAIAVIGNEDPTGIGRDIRRVTVSNSLAMPFGRFNIELAPRPVLNGQTWSQIIKPASRVAISFHRKGSADDSATTPAPTPIMVGLVDQPGTSEDFTQQAPHRSCSLTGRMLSSLLTDHRWFFHSVLSVQGSDQAPALPQFSDFLVGEAPTVGTVQREAFLRNLGILAVNPELFLLTNRAPARLMSAAFDFFVGNETAPGFIKVLYADGVPLSKLLVFDGALAEAAYFDPAARLTQAQLPTQLPNASGWDIMRAQNEWPYQEIFSDVVGANLGSAFVRVTSRKAPFAGSIVSSSQGPSVGFGDSQRPQLRGQSLFDEQAPGWDRYAETVYIGDQDVRAIPTMRRSCEGEARVFTLYQVTPRLTPMAGNQGVSPWAQFILPIIDEDPDSPSYIRRYGVRVFDRKLNSVQALDEEGEQLPQADIARRCGAYASLAREWFYRMPEMWEGTYVLKGRTDVRIGKRLVDVDRKMEFYIVAVSHTIDNEQNGAYTTTCNVVRGWELNQAL